jgi:hypothetical protein
MCVLPHSLIFHLYFEVSSVQKPQGRWEKRRHTRTSPSKRHLLTQEHSKHALFVPRRGHDHHLCSITSHDLDRQPARTSDIAAVAPDHHFDSERHYFWAELLKQSASPVLPACPHRTAQHARHSIVARRGRCRQPNRRLAEDWSAEVVAAIPRLMIAHRRACIPRRSLVVVAVCGFCTLEAGRAWWATV